MARTSGIDTTIVEQKKWDESKHPREPKGTEGGGQWTEKFIQSEPVRLEKAGDDALYAIKEAVYKELRLDAQINGNTIELYNNVTGSLMGTVVFDERGNFALSGRIDKISVAADIIRNTIAKGRAQGALNEMYYNTVKGGKDRESIEKWMKG